MSVKAIASPAGRLFREVATSTTNDIPQRHRDRFGHHGPDHHVPRYRYALRIGKNKSTDAVLFTAGAHAREWGGADICLSFATDLIASYTAKAGRTYGGKSFSALEIKRIVEGLNVVVFPCVNPDGRKFDQEHSGELWRRNRNPKDSGGIAKRIGVDINRNHAFLWDFRKAFAADALGTASDDPSDEIYHGSTADSEPETRNVHWLFDTFPRIRWYMDIHCYSGDVLWSWGDDTDQTMNHSMTFSNPTYDGQRGVEGGYGEYIPLEDLTAVEDLAKRVRNAINDVHGGSYVAKQGVYLLGTDEVKVTYPTSGCADDWAFARHLVDPSKVKVYAFTLEFGPWTGNRETSFHIPWDEMTKIIPEIDAGLLEFCASSSPPMFVPPQNLIPWELWRIFALGRLPSKPPRPPRPEASIGTVVLLGLAVALLWGINRLIRRVWFAGNLR
jgi:murein tripeptide amidase MpaA